MTEMSVLQDVLNIAKQKHYMVLDTVSAEAPQSRSGLHLMAKKRVRFSGAIFNTAHVCTTHEIFSIARALHMAIYHTWPFLHK